MTRNVITNQLSPKVIHSNIASVYREAPKPINTIHFIFASVGNIQVKLIWVLWSLPSREEKKKKVKTIHHHRDLNSIPGCTASSWVRNFDCFPAKGVYGLKAKGLFLRTQKWTDIQHPVNNEYFCYCDPYSYLFLKIYLNELVGI